MVRVVIQYHIFYGKKYDYKKGDLTMVFVGIISGIVVGVALASWMFISGHGQYEVDE